jgi:hypothetical protein
MKVKLRSWHFDGQKRCRPGDVVDVSAEDAARLIAMTGAEPAVEPPAPAVATVEATTPSEPAEPPAPAAQPTPSVAPNQQQAPKGQKR